MTQNLINKDEDNKKTISFSNKSSNLTFSKNGNEGGAKPKTRSNMDQNDLL